LQIPEFHGWIPNVAGRLSFSHIGQAKRPSPCETLNEDDAVGRAIICIQPRVLSDALVHPAYFRFIYNYDPRWVFVLTALSGAEGSDRIGRIKGFIHIFTRASWDEPNQVESTEASQSSSDIEGSPRELPPRTLLDNVVSEVESSVIPPSGRAAKLRDLVPALQVEMNRAAVFVVKCEIDRVGIVKLAETSRHSNVEFASSVSEAPAPLDDKAARYLCNQAFFFLKDIAHVHRHHHHRSDTITAAYPKDAKQSWIRETQYSIHRKIVTLRRTATPLNLYDALGIMAYMSSFAKIVSEGEAQSEGKDVALQYNIGEIENSIKASLERRRWLRVQFNLIITAIPALLLATAALLKPTQGVPGASQVHETLFDSIRSVLTSTLTPDIYGALSVLAIMSMVPFIFGVLDPRRTISALDVKRVIVVWSKRRQVTIWTLLALANLVAGFYLLYRVGAGTSYVALGWKMVGFEVAATAIVLLGFPYIFTIPDLWLRLRGRDVLQYRRLHRTAS
jgi:hypothetical protein